MESRRARGTSNSWMPQIQAKWLGHSTVLLKIGETTILTDPVFSGRIGVGVGPFTIGMKRITPPALTVDEVGTPDLILLSHAHFDHFDLRSLRALENPATTVVTAKHTSDLLRVRRYAAVHELGWDESKRIGEITIRAFPVKHWGARMQTDRHRGYNGYTIEGAGKRIIFGGDTALTDSFRSLKDSRGWDLAIMPIGAYNPWIYAHCTPEQAWRMGNDAGAEFFLPVHHQTFALSREPFREPIERFQSAAGRNSDRVGVNELGGEFRI
jgi:L-ascorbate metabolism protein UlaG (beta-lactamase superfamily)